MKKIKKYWSIFKNDTKLMFKEFFNKNTNKKQRANMWTFSRLVTSFLIPILSILSIISANFSLFITSICVTGFAAATDFFDGRSARKHNSFSEYGKLLDQVADKIFSIMVGINLALFNPLFLMTLLGEGIIAGINISYKFKNNLDIKSTQIGRIKQWPLSVSLILGFISLLIPNLTTITNIMVSLTFLLQLASASSYIINNNKKIQQLKIEEKNTLVNLNANLENKNEKVKTLDNKNNNRIENNKKISIEKQCENLRNLRNELIESNSEVDSLKSDGYQKRKK